VRTDAKQPSTISFNFIGQTLNLSGLSDTAGKFYQHHWPTMHTPVTFVKSKKQYQNILCGRFVSADMDTMIELWIKWPNERPISETEILKLKNDTIWTLNSSKGKKSNYNKATHTVTGISFQMKYFNKNREYLSDVEPLGFICLNQIKKASGEIYSSSGIFECNVHGSDYVTRRITKGKFNLEFYIGL
jgi:hypothetical protein